VLLTVYVFFGSNGGGYSGLLTVSCASELVCVHATVLWVHEAGCLQSPYYQGVVNMVLGLCSATPWPAVHLFFRQRFVLLLFICRCGVLGYNWLTALIPLLIVCRPSSLWHGVTAMQEGRCYAAHF
jgi:hypothetical protein